MAKKSKRIFHHVELKRGGNKTQRDHLKALHNKINTRIHS